MSVSWSDPPTSIARTLARSPWPDGAVVADDRPAPRCWLGRGNGFRSRWSGRCRSIPSCLGPRLEHLYSAGSGSDTNIEASKIIPGRSAIWDGGGSTYASGKAEHLQGLVNRSEVLAP